MDFARRRPLPELQEDTKVQIARILQAWGHALSTYRGDFLFGDLSVADCMYAPVVSRFLTYDVPVPDAVKAYMARMMALPAMQEWGKVAQQEVDNAKA
jgi:glutathione S-transferase